jgi:hypothetical protein
MLNLDRRCAPAGARRKPEQSSFGYRAATTFALTLPLSFAWAAEPDPHLDAAAALTHFEAAPLVFERNRGQTDARVEFLARGQNYQLFLSGPDATLKFTPRAAKPGAAATQVSAVRVRWLNSNRAASAMPYEPLAGHTNYFRGGSKPAAITDIETYGRVRYSSIYPGVDLVYYAAQGQLEYDLVVAPGADAGRIHFALDGEGRTSLDGSGDVVIRTPSGDALLHRPVVYQMIAGERHSVQARYVHEAAGTYRIATAAYDRSAPLVIDPVLSYGSYLGGSTGGTTAYAIAVDASGSAYVTGTTNATDFPVVSAYKSTISGTGDSDVFVTKFNPAGSALVYSTYIGATPARKSTTSQHATAIAVDASGSAYVAGMTNASNFPTTSGAYQAGVTGGSAFVTKLSPAGSALTYSTYLLNTAPVSIAVDGAGNAYLTGTANATFQTTAGAFQATSSGTRAFVASLNATGTSMRYATFLGGSGTDTGTSIAVDTAGYAVVAGSTTSSNFPTTVGAYQTAIHGLSDGFVAKLNTAGSGLVFSTYFGGSQDDYINGVAIDASGATYVVGETYSTDLPQRNAFQPVKAGRNLWNSSQGNVFVAKLVPGGDALAYGSFLGGEVCSTPCQPSFGQSEYRADIGQAIAVDATGRAYITGKAQSFMFPLVNTLIANQGSNTVLQNSAFLAKIAGAGNAVLYNTLTTTDYGTDFVSQNGFSVAVDPASNAYGAGTAATPGQAGSIDLISSGSFKSVPVSSTLALVYKLASATPSLTLTSSSNPAASQSPITLSATIGDTSLAGSVTFYDGSSNLGSAPLSGGAALLATALSAGVHRLTAIYRSSNTAADSALLYEVVNPALVCK